MIDNYDSFTYNLVQYLGELGADVQVHRNDAITLDEIAAAAAGRHRHLARARARRARRASRCRSSSGSRARSRSSASVSGTSPSVPRFGGRDRARARASCTARPRRSTTTAAGVFAGLPNPFDATRYHSLVDRAGRRCPPSSRSPPWTADGRDHGRAPPRHPVEGVQFHPESILTTQGKQLLRNFLDRLTARGRAVTRDRSREALQALLRPARSSEARGAGGLGDAIMGGARRRRRSAAC